MPRRINITQEHIDESTKKDSSHCMIAEGIKDTIPGVTRVSVDLATIRYTHKGKRMIYLTPRPAQIALLKFDQGKPLSPFTLRLGSPAQTIEVKKRNKSAVTKQVIRTGGKTPPTGPLAGGAVPSAAKHGQLRTGAIRRYGLKAITE